MSDSRDDWHLPRPRPAPGPARPGHGHRQRHAGQLLRRRPLRRRRRRRRPRPANWSSRAPTCSTSAANRPGPAPSPSPLDEELRRVVPVVRELAARTDVPLSVDTYKAEVARQAPGGRGARHQRHHRPARRPGHGRQWCGTSGRRRPDAHAGHAARRCRSNPTYDDVVAEVARFLEARLQAAADLGIAGGAGGARPRHRLRQDGRAQPANCWPASAELQRLGRPVCLGVSRKGFLGKLLGRPVEERLAGSLAAVCHAAGAGAGPDPPRPRRGRDPRRRALFAGAAERQRRCEAAIDA